MAQTNLFRLTLRLNILNNSKYLRNGTNILKRYKSTKVKTASSVYRAMNIFDRNAKRLQKERSARSEDYHLVEHIKEEIGWRTADRVFDIKRTFKNAVELGASRGYVSRHFLPDSVEKVMLCDTSQTHLDKAIVGDGVKVDKIIMDEENFDFPENSIDLLVSSLALHWVNDLPGCFDRIMKCLQPDGVFMATVFGGDTLMELRQSLQLAETERLGGMFPHVSPFTRIRDIGGLLTAQERYVIALPVAFAPVTLLPITGLWHLATPFWMVILPSIGLQSLVRWFAGCTAGRSGFTLQTVDIDSITIWYPSAWHVMWDVRSMGEGNAAHNRPLRLSSDVQFTAAALYDEMFGKEIPERGTRGVPATFQIINFLGWKPDPSQPKPMDRGTGEMSLKDLHRIDEIIKDTKKVELRDEDMK